MQYNRAPKELDLEIDEETDNQGTTYTVQTLLFDEIIYATPIVEELIPQTKENNIELVVEPVQVENAEQQICCTRRH